MTGSPISAIIAARKQWDESPAGILARALVVAARTHHNVSRLTKEGAGWHLAEQHWQYCQSHSCTEVMRAMVRAGVPGYRAKLVIRKRRIEQQNKRILGRKSLP